MFTPWVQYLPLGCNIYPWVQYLPFGCNIYPLGAIFTPWVQYLPLGCNIYTLGAIFTPWVQYLPLRCNIYEHDITNFIAIKVKKKRKENNPLRIAADINCKRYD
jgi:hypothetical protein